MNRQERLEAVYNYLRNTGRVHTQKDFAEAVGYTETSISKAFNGVKTALTDNLLKAIVHKYQPLFSLEWILTGNGAMLNSTDEVKASDEYNIDPDPEQQSADILVDMFKAARKERTEAHQILEDLRRSQQEIESARSEILSLRNELKAARNSMLEAAADFSSAAKQLRAISATLSVDYFSTGQLAADSLPKPPVATSAPSQGNNSSTPSSSRTSSAQTSGKVPSIPESAKSDSATNNLSSTSKTSK